MKCEYGKFKYKIPAFSDILHVCLRGKEYDVQIIRITPDQMLSLDFSLVSPHGIPSCFSIIERELWLWPVPNCEYEIIIRYAPPVMEF